MKRFFIIILVLILVATIIAFVYRYRIIQYSAENIIRGMLPPYVRIDKITFDIRSGRITLNDFKILNPSHFSDRYLLEIAEISCEYKLKGENILDGFEVEEPSFNKMVLNIERLGDGRLNLEDMKKYIDMVSPVPKAAEPGKQGQEKTPSIASSVSKIVGNKRISDMVTLPETFSLKGGKVMFIDRFPHTKPHLITFEDIEAKLSIRLDKDYTKLIDLRTTGRGNVNGNRNEVVEWNIALNPAATKLTMSSRFEVRDVDILSFEPYYDKYSPFVFRRGHFSGTLIFDFDNGNIGSTNEVHLSDILFYIKRGYENTQFWETNVQDLARYFTNAFGDIVFDFKIKGEMANPKFYLGPISKQALASMAIDKISSAIQEVTGKGQAQGRTGAPKSDLEKAKEVIDLFKGLMKK